MERTERLLDLVALLLDAQEPVPWSTIRTTFPDDYSGISADAAERKFERDKAELLELGIALKYIQADEDRPDGYLIDKNAYYLPEIALTPAELAVLYAAGSAALASGAFPGRHDLAHALRKVGFFSSDPLPAPKVRIDLGTVADTRELPGRLDLLWSAINTRKTVQLEYFSPHSQQVTRRSVDPWGLALRRGLWSLVGFCHLRNEVRTFHVHRIRSLSANAQKPRTPDFEVPADFRLEDFVPSWPWQVRLHPPIDVALRVVGALTPLAQRLFPGARAAHAGDGGVVTVAATDVEGLLRYVLSLAPEVQVLSPPLAMERYESMARRILNAHRSEP